MLSWLGLLALFVVGAATMLFTTPVSMRVAHLFGAIDEPGELTVHPEPVPRLGGLAILLATFGLAGIAFAVGLAPAVRSIWVLALATVAIAVLGFVDDVRGLRQITKFLLEAVIALGFLWVAVRGLSGTGTFAATLALVGLANAYNFIDGLDGLAAGVAATNLLGLGALFFLSGATGHATVAVLSAGACVGFLRFNWWPARVFMGDGGALATGFLIGALSVLYVEASEPLLSALVAVVVLAGIPIGDLALTILRRIATRRTLRPDQLFRGDREHYYDQMREKGVIDGKGAVLVSYAVAIPLAMVGIATAHVTGGAAVIAVAFACAMLLMAVSRYFQVGLS